MKDNQYYEDFQKKVMEKIEEAQQYIDKADVLDRYHKQIKNRKWLFVALDKIICWERDMYWKMANDIYIKYFEGCIDEINELENYLKGEA